MILLCYDGSPSAKHAISFVHTAFESPPVTLLQVWSPPFPAADSFGLAATPARATFTDVEQYSRERSEAIALEGCEFARGLGLAVETRVERSPASVWQTILDVSDDLGADCIVVGTRGVTAVESALLGSISNAVVHHSKRPVLVVPTN